MSSTLNHFDVLYKQIPSLYTFDISFSTIRAEPSISREETWPQELKNVCEILYDKHMDSLSNLRESQKFSLFE